MRGITDISNKADIIDSRDIIARIKELEEEREELVDDINLATQEAQDNTDYHVEALREAIKNLAVWEEDEGEELKALLSVQEQAEGYSDWEYGEALIRDSYFTEYAEELARDIGAVNDNTDKWPYNHIDWEAAADELKQDYTCVDYDGVDYWIRS